MLESMARRMSNSIEPCYTLGGVSANGAKAMDFSVGTPICPLISDGKRPSLLAALKPASRASIANTSLVNAARL